MSRRLRRIHQKMQTVTEAEVAQALNLPPQATRTGLGNDSSTATPGPQTRPTE